jgi:hypothetical protein
MLWVVPLSGQAATLVGLQPLELLLGLVDQWQELGRQLRLRPPPAIRTQVR